MSNKELENNDLIVEHRHYLHDLNINSVTTYGDGGHLFKITRHGVTVLVGLDNTKAGRVEISVITKGKTYHTYGKRYKEMLEK